MKQYIYSRVSTDKQETENQLHALKALYPNAEVVEEYISGAKATKPVLDSLIKRMVSGDVLIIAALDRLGRKTGPAITLIDKLYATGITVISIREGLDYSTSTGKLVGQIMMAVSENERNLISERTKAALKRLQDSGVVLGRRSISLEERARAAATRSQSLKAKVVAGEAVGRPAQDQSALVSKLQELKSQGLSQRAIAQAVGLSQSRVNQLLRP